MKKEKSCGSIIFLEQADGLAVLLVHHNLGHWGLPKGHVELGETEEETAAREVFEETGIESIVIPGFRKQITYCPKKNISKDVIFFIGKAINSSDPIAQLSEVCEAKFIKIQKCFSLITYQSEQEVLKEALLYYQKNIKNI